MTHICLHVWLSDLIAADTSCHQRTYAITNFEGFVWNQPIFLLLCSAFAREKTWQPLLGNINRDYVTGSPEPSIYRYTCEWDPSARTIITIYSQHPKNPQATT